MFGTKDMLIIQSVVCILLLHHANAAGGKETTVESSVGGGECVNHNDCSGNGVCETTEGKEIGACLCNVNFRGPNCQDEAATKMGGQDIKPDPGSKKSFHIESPSTSSRSSFEDLAKRSGALEYDTQSNVVGLDPKILADTDQPFLIYSPVEKKYLYMSNDKVWIGKHNTHLEARGDRNGKRNMFTLKAKSNGKYHIYNVHTQKYVYVAKSTTGIFKWESNNVLGAEGEPSTQNTPQKFEFEFVGNDAGFYKIKNADKYLFVATFRAGIPLHNIIEADDRDRTEDQTQLFQFVLKDKATVTVEYKIDQMVEEKATDIDCAEHKYENDNKDASPLSTTITFDKTFTTTSSYSKTTGYTITGSFTAGITVLEALKLGATVTGSRQSTEQTTDTKTEQQKFAQTFTVTVKGGEMACVVILIDRADYSIPFEMTALTSDKKKLIAYGKYYGSRHYNTRARQQILPWEENKKCPFEEKRVGL